MWESAESCQDTQVKFYIQLLFLYIIGYFVAGTCFLIFLWKQVTATSAFIAFLDFLSNS